jgi:hypothetical protein
LRIGAQTSCSSCAHRFAIHHEHIKQLQTAPSEAEDDTENPLLLGGVIAKPPPPHRAPPRSRGDDALLSEADDGDLAETNLKPLQPVVEHQEPSEDVARVIARHRSRRQRRGKIIFAAVVVTLVFFGFIAAIITHMASKDLSFFQALVSVFGGETEESQVGAGISQLVGKHRVVPSKAMLPTFWEDVEEIFDGKIPPSQATLINIKTPKRSPQRSIFTAQVQISGQDVIEDAVLHMKLIDRNNRVFAHRDMALMLLSGHKASSQSRPMSVMIPQRLMDRTERIVTHIEPTVFIQGGAMFDKVIYERKGEGSETAIVITAYNPLGTAMQRAVFYIRAFDDNGDILARWKVEWNDRIDPRQRVEFATITRVQPQWKIAAWEVIGAGGLNLAGTGAVR